MKIAHSLGLALTLAAGPPHSALPAVVANDNRAPAGQWRHDTLAIRLIVTMATWHPEAETGPGIDVAAFAEEGRAPQVPAPLLRVRAGTVIRAWIRNTLIDSTITLYGLHTRPAAKDDSLRLRPGDSARVTFLAGEPGTYLYGAVLGKHDFAKDEEREQLGGAFVVDPVGGSPPDRIMVMNIWGRVIDSSDYGNALTINGRSWPYDERVDANVGDTLRWRVVNATVRGHPMHLHGFYFDVMSLGDSRRDTTYAAGEQIAAVTQSMAPFSTMYVEWSPTRPGNWLFHCHIGPHVVPGGARLNPSPPEAHDRMSDDPQVHMAGLVVGIAVHAPPGYRPAPRANTRQLHLFVQEGHAHGRATRALGFVLQRGARAPASDSIVAPGSTLVLTRGQPTDITVINRLHESAAIHWHGIELESFSDGVAGWSGAAKRVAPSIQPGDSFVAHLTLPRAGTFIYHTHMNDIEQLTSGLYGPLIVLEPGQRLDPATDHVYIAGHDGADAPIQILVNGDSLLAPMQLRAGVPHRFRLINIGPGGSLRYTINRDSVPERWTPIAKDGATLPRSRTAPRVANARIDVGETYDFTWTPAPGTYEFKVTRPKSNAVVQKLEVR
jgi:FtsP/CotA-like multicopper oxidase with cupredoxin domain